MDKNIVVDCYLSPVWGQWQSKTLFLSIFDPRSSIVLAFSIAANPLYLRLTINFELLYLQLCTTGV